MIKTHYENMFDWIKPLFEWVRDTSEAAIKAYGKACVLSSKINRLNYSVGSEHEEEFEEIQSLTSELLDVLASVPFIGEIHPDFFEIITRYESF